MARDSIWSQQLAEMKPQYKKKYKKSNTYHVKIKKRIKPDGSYVINQIRMLDQQIRTLQNKRQKLVDILGQANNNSQPIQRDIKLYVLELEDNCWYVGMSSSVERRFKIHQKGKGAFWTRLHPPIKVHEIRDTGLYEDSKAARLEDALTLEYAAKYGTGYVRGGGYCQNKPRWPSTVVKNLTDKSNKLIKTNSTN